MEVYYTKKEYNEMKNRLTKQVKKLTAENEKLKNQLKEEKENYKVLLESATEEVEDNSVE